MPASKDLLALMGERNPHCYQGLERSGCSLLTSGLQGTVRLRWQELSPELQGSLLSLRPQLREGGLIAVVRRCPVHRRKLSGTLASSRQTLGTHDSLCPCMITKNVSRPCHESPGEQSPK